MLGFVKRFQVYNLLERLKKSGKRWGIWEIPVAQLSEAGSIRFCNLVQKSSETLTNPFSFGGMGASYEEAILKALSEWAERQAFFSQIESNSYDSFRHTDGMGAYPVLFPVGWNRENAQKNARNHALCEALERFIWHQWWTQTSIGSKIRKFFNIDTFLNEFKSPLIKDLIFQIKSLIEIHSINLIEPDWALTPESDSVVNKFQKYRSRILLLKTKDGGFLSGGCFERDEYLAVTRMLGEIFHHAKATWKFLNAGNNVESIEKLKSIYERRLLFFSLGLGSRLVEDRLNTIGSESVILPNIAIDTQLSHTFENEIVIHRCLFKNQPDFLGGGIDKFCI